MGFVYALSTDGDTKIGTDFLRVGQHRPGRQSKINREYPVTYARRMTTQYGPTVQLTLRTDDDENVKVYLPKRYAEIFKDTDTDDINNSTKHYKLICQGKKAAHTS